MKVISKISVPSFAMSGTQKRGRERVRARSFLAGFTHAPVRAGRMVRGCAIKRSPPPLCRGGFTLIELLVVIGIIAMLSTFAAAAFNNARAKARDVKRIHEIRVISKALDMYYGDYGYYPARRESGTCVTREALSSQGYRISDTCQPSPVYLKDLLKDYLPTLPLDPINNGNIPYVCCAIKYFVTADGMQYDLFTVLETDHKDSCQYKNWVSHTGGVGGLVPGPNESWCGSAFSGWPASKRVYADH